MARPGREYGRTLIRLEDGKWRAHTTGGIKKLAMGRLAVAIDFCEKRNIAEGRDTRKDINARKKRSRDFQAALKRLELR